LFRVDPALDMEAETMSHEPDVPDADAAEQEREWDEHEDEPRRRHIPPDAPEADYLDQMRDADLDDEDWE
jgi:hypothetical protein